MGGRSSAPLTSPLPETAPAVGLGEGPWKAPSPLTVQFRPCTHSGHRELRSPSAVCMQENQYSSRCSADCSKQLPPGPGCLRNCLKQPADPVCHGSGWGRRNRGLSTATGCVRGRDDLTAGTSRLPELPCTVEAAGPRNGRTWSCRFRFCGWPGRGPWAAIGTVQQGWREAEGRGEGEVWRRVFEVPAHHALLVHTSSSTRLFLFQSREQAQRQSDSPRRPHGQVGPTEVSRAQDREATGPEPCQDAGRPSERTS